MCRLAYLTQSFDLFFIAQFLNLDSCNSIGGLEFFPLVCSAISHVHVLLNAGE